MKVASFKIEGDGKGALSALSQVQRKVHSLSHEINQGLKGAMLDGFSAVAIGEAIRGTIDFAEEIKKTSDRLNVSTDNLQALKLAARDAGKDIGFMEKSFTLLEKSARKALGGSGSQKKAFANLGISDEDLKHLNKVDLLSKMMRGTAGMGRTEAEGNLASIVGSKNAGALMAMQPKLANFNQFKDDKKKEGAIASNEDIANLAELKDNWLEVSDALRTQAIPALAWLLETIFDLGHGAKQIVAIVGTYLGALVGAFTHFDLSGFAMALVRNAGSLMESIASNLIGLIAGRVKIKDILGNIAEDQLDAINAVVKGAVGKDTMDIIDKAVSDKLAEQAKEDKVIEDERARKRKQREDDQKKKDGPVNRVADVKADKAAKDKNLGQLAGDAGIKIGNFLNADTRYRVERAQNEMAQDIKRTAEATEKTAEGVDKLVDVMNDPDNAAPGLGAD